MARVYTKELRREIITDFAARHGGQYLPAAFVAEVRKKGKRHPAYGWFTWDLKKAVQEYHLWQAREFVNGIIVKFSVQELHRGKVHVREREMPFVMSPIESRSDGGGYYVTDPDDPEHMIELCRQGAQALEMWLRRYSAAVSFSKGSIAPLERQLQLLQSTFAEELQEAAE